MKQKTKENILGTLLMIALGAFAAYGIIGAIIEGGDEYQLRGVKVVPLYKSECGHIRGLKEYHEHCEVK